MSQAPEADSAPPTSGDAYSEQLGELNSLIASGGSFSGNERNCAFVNVNGQRFATASSALGFDFLDDARSIGMFDWDWDGRMDAWVANRTAPRLRLLSNQLQAGSWLKLKLVGTKSNRDAVGARVELEFETGKQLIRTVRAGEGFLSQSTKWVHFGLGEAATIKSVTVHWPGSRKQVFRGFKPQTHCILTQGRKFHRTLQVPSIKVAGKPGSVATTPETSDPPQILLSYRPTLPPVTFKASDGKTQKVQQIFSGKPVLINLWASWCAPCREELQDFAQAASKFEKAGLQILPLASDLDPDPAKEREILSAAQVKFPTGRVTSEAREMLGSIFNYALSAKRELPAPASFLIDAKGQLAAIYAGTVSPARILSDVAQLDSDPDLSGNWLDPPVGANFLFLVLDLMEQNKLDEAYQAAKANHRLISAHKEYPKFLVWVGDSMIKAGRVNEAVSAYLTALNLNPTDPVVMNNVAWQMATHPSSDVRNGPEALKWAKLAAEKTQHADATYLDTLAAAYAENGDFESAIETATKAMQLATRAKQRALIPGLKKALQFYQAGKPFR